MRIFNGRGKPVAITKEIAAEAVKSTPPITLAAYGSVADAASKAEGFTLNDWLILAGIGWIAIQAVVFLHKYIVWLKAGKPTKEKT